MIKLLQRDINMALAWWMDTGIHFKMGSDIRAEYGSHLNTWRQPTIRGNQPLGFSHVVPSIIIFGVATFISIIAFALENVHYFPKQNKIKKNKRRRQRRQKRGMAQPKRTRAQPEIPKKAWA